MISSKAINIFSKVIEHYHIIDDINQKYDNPYKKKTIENLLHKKVWIDTIQWHLEDIIRDPNIDVKYALKIKREIDLSNQNRTDIVEQVDDYFLNLYSDVKIKKNAKINTESPAWALDRLSILQLKIYHMNEEASRTTSSIENRAVCLSKLKILMEQNTDLSLSIDQLLLEIGSGEKIMKVYKQMKMFNDINLNPILYKKKA
ncbi:MAG: DUF4254 domain-containing protein [Bacteroidota bacterium]|nr:DUF4254 domain-containing protein [Bacteroidota bacterium]